MAFQFTDDNFQEVAIDKKGVSVVDFWAEWCGPCRMITPIIEELSGEYDGKATIGKLNVDHNPNVSMKYGVRSIPTILILKDGEVVQQGEPQSVLLKPNDPYIEDFVSDINRARVLRVRSVMTKGKVSKPVHGIVDINDNLEDLIALSEGDASKNYQVNQDGKPVGMLNMKDLLIALVPRISSSQSE